MLDIMVGLLFLTPKRYQRMISHVPRNVLLATLWKPKAYDPQIDFMGACANGNKVIMKNILQKYADRINVNARDRVTGNTGLHMGCERGHLNIVQSLIECKKRNVKLNLENVKGHTPLALAVNGGHKLIVKILLKCQGLKLMLDRVEELVRVASEKNHFPIAKMILQEYKSRNGNVCDSSLGMYIDRAEESICKKDDEHAEIFKKAIQDWFISRNAAKTEQKAKSKRSKEEVWQDIRDHFECSICYEEFKDGEIYSCENDHWICRGCKSSWTTNCPTCRSYYGDNWPMRRHKVEKVLKDFRTWCAITKDKDSP